MTVMFFRTVIVYVLLLLVLRLMGKRQIGELQPSELVTTLLLSEIAAQPVIDDNIPISYGIVPVTVVIALEVIASFAVTKCPRLKKIFIGKPSVLINRGKLDIGEMSKVRITAEELLSELRLQGVGDIRDVYYAVMEENGKLSVIPKASASPSTKADVGAGAKENGMARAIVVEGKINDENLTALGKDRAWLYKQIKAQNTALEDIFLMTCGDSGETGLLTKGKSKK
ncbi:MAG: DUF421 domain-containing protein [Clostridia bacterium]|nr:DUF421 domain-containing protein [Clostridia bacterium]